MNKFTVGIPTGDFRRQSYSTGTYDARKHGDSGAHTSTVRNSLAITLLTELVCMPYLSARRA